MATAPQGKSLNVKSLQRNRELRTLLVYIASHPDSTLNAIAKAFEWLSPKTRNALDSLYSAELIYVSKKESTSFKTPIHFYSVCEHTEDDLDTELPIKRADTGVVQISARSSTGHVVNRDSYGGWIAGNVQRDPLDLALMGTGIAPSILFKRSQDASA
jgi:hypothetical protein